MRLFQTDHRKCADADKNSEGKGKNHWGRSNSELWQLYDASGSRFVTQKISDGRYITK
jgi:hypothetical protein